MEKKRLIELVRNYIKDYPGDSADFLDAVADGLRDYKRAVDQSRHIESDLGFLGMIGLVMGRNQSPEKKAICMYRVIPLHFPTGFEGPWCDEEVKFLEQFCDLYFNKTTLHGSEWEASNSNPEFFKMLKRQWDGSH